MGESHNGLSMDWLPCYWKNPYLTLVISTNASEGNSGVHDALKKKSAHTLTHMCAHFFALFALVALFACLHESVPASV